MGEPSRENYFRFFISNRGVGTNMFIVIITGFVFIVCFALGVYGVYHDHKDAYKKK